MGQLKKVLPTRLVGICAGYREGALVAAVAAVTLRDNDGLVLEFPKTNPFLAGAPITVHLDDRVASDVYSVELRVHRMSYKGLVTAVKGLRADVAPVDGDLFYGSRVAVSLRTEGYRHPADDRPAVPLGPTPLTAWTQADDGERSNQLGVLITRGVDRPHSTVMAFLSTPQDDVFLITRRGSHKYQLLLKDPRSAFALDHRAHFVFERQVDWNYTLVETLARRVDRSSALFAPVQREFIRKNPWEEAFFSHPEAEMLHLEPKRIFQQDVLCP